MLARVVGLLAGPTAGKGESMETCGTIESRNVMRGNMLATGITDIPGKVTFKNAILQCMVMDEYTHMKVRGRPPILTKINLILDVDSSRVGPCG